MFLGTSTQKITAITVAAGLGFFECFPVHLPAFAGQIPQKATGIYEVKEGNFPITEVLEEVCPEYKKLVLQNGVRYTLFRRDVGGRNKIYLEGTFVGKGNAVQDGNVFSEDIPVFTNYSLGAINDPFWVYSQRKKMVAYRLINFGATQETCAGIEKSN
jgi:hypothetical protein